MIENRPFLSDPLKVIVELFDLELNDADDGKWVESARWIKYEEVFFDGFCFSTLGQKYLLQDAEGVDLHWGQPHVAFLSFHSLIQLRKCLAKGMTIVHAVTRSISNE